jgi:hypothetical protein
MIGENQQYSEKPLSHCHFDTKYTCTDLGVNKGLRNERPAATVDMSHGTVS